MDVAPPELSPWAASPPTWFWLVCVAIGWINQSVPTLLGDPRSRW